MKIQNGNWLSKEGYELFSPTRISEIEKTENSITLYSPTKQFNCSMLTIKITTPAPEVIRVQAFHYMGIKNENPTEFELNLNTNSKINCKEDEKYISIISGSLILIIDKENWAMWYERDEEVLTKSSGKDLAYLKTDWKNEYYSYDEKNAYMRQQLGISIGELIYGLGERFTPFAKNGQSVDIWNEDGGTGTELSYKNIPFYLSNKGYGVFVNHPENVSFEIGSEAVAKTSFCVKGENLDYFLINGPDMKTVLKRYTDLTGKPSLPPSWTFGLWLSTSFVTNYDEETVMGFIDEMNKRDIPLKVFHFDCLWMKNFHWTDFVWDPDTFPDPKGMIKRIHEREIKVCVWINSYIAQRSSLFEEGCKKGYFLKRTNGDVWQWDMWQPGLAIIDFTNPGACLWYKEKLKALLEMGVDCFKTDFGERIPIDAIYYNNANPEKMHNYYSYLYNKIVYETIEEVKGKDEAVLFARSATVGGQKFPVHWGGDCAATYESMAESLRGGLSLTSSGFGFWSHDIGGFEDTSTPDVYKRWSAFGLLSTHSRLHGSISYRVPWNYGDEAVEVLRHFTKLKMSLMPYIYSSSVLTSDTGVPLMRSMVLEFMEDLNCQYLDKQYMLGDSILVAPIFNEEGIATFYLPDGEWTDYFTGEKYSGGKWYKKKCNYFEMPIMIRENSIIPIGNRSDVPDYEYSDGVEYRIYNLIDSASFMIYKDSNDDSLIEAKRENDFITIDVKNEKSFSIRLVNQKVVSVKEGYFEVKGNDTVIHAQNSHQLIINI